METQENGRKNVRKERTEEEVKLESLALIVNAGKPSGTATWKTAKIEGEVSRLRRKYL